MKINKFFLFCGAISGALTIAIGSFGAHGLKGVLNPTMMDTFQTGVEYQGLHSLALLITGLIMTKNQTSLKLSGWLFIFGILFFSGGLYVFSLMALGWMHFLIPLGGTAFLLGWILLAIGVVKK
tara:strand:- start:604 stop:975 length:372 start_codon:yes stop_codon:yes gene_type:complete